MHRRLGLAIVVVSASAPLAHAQAPAPDPDSGEPAAPAPAPSEEAAPPPPAPPPVTTPEPAPPPVVADTAAPSAPTVSLGHFDVKVGGYFQPQLRFRQNDAVAQFDEDGFRVRRARLITKGRGSSDGFDYGVDLEGEMTPTFSLLDADVFAAKKLSGNGEVKLTAGQFKAPFSRETLLSDSVLAFVEKPELASLGPDRQIGAQLSLRAPSAPWLQAAAGIFDGEGRNQPQNIDEHFMYMGRVELRPFGWDTPLQESALNGTYLTIGGSIGHNTLVSGDGTEKDLYLGFDVSGAWKGLSGTVEYLEIQRTFGAGSMQPNSKANGDVAQVSYLLPFAGWLANRFEVGARVEEIDRNDTVPIVQKGDANQSLRYYTLGLSYYHWKHALKLQVTASHIVELEDQDRNMASAKFDNDTVLIQATYRLE